MTEQTFPRLTESLAAGLPKGSAQLGRFILLQEIGAGAMGRVYAAYDDALDRRVAVKLLRRDGPRPQDRVRIRREATAMAQLSHPNVAQIHDVGEVDDRLFLAMEYIDGPSLATWEQGRPWRERLAMYIDAGRGLAAVHAAGILHRDFKPQNVLIGRDGRPRVIDFGLARSVAPEPITDLADALADTGSFAGIDVSVTTAGSIVGTPAYMPLEQFKAEPLCPKSDQFAFCVALYEAVYGVPPYPRDELPRLIRAIGEHAVEPAPDDTDVPDWLRDALVRGLSPDPDDRWPSMDALLDELAHDRAHDPETGRPERLLLVASVAVVVLGSTAYGIVATGLDIPDPRRGFALALVVGAWLATMLVVLRRTVRESVLNRAVAVFFLCAIGVVLALRGATWALDADPRPTYIHELCALTALCLLCAPIVARWFGWLAAIVGAATPLAIVFTDALIPIYATATVLAAALAVYFTRADRARTEDHP